MSGNSPSCFQVLVPVWGQAYVDLYLNYSLPSQLTPGNLGELSSGINVNYKVITSQEWVSVIKRHPAFVRLAGLVDAEVITPPGVNFSDSDHYRAFSACYAHGMKNSVSRKMGCLFVTADQIWTDGSLGHVLSLARQGTRVVLMGGMRLDSSTALDDLAELLNSNELTGRRAVRLALDHLHPWDRSLFRDNQNHGRPASFMYWAVDDEGILMRCLHLHPVFINKDGDYPSISGTIDRGDFVACCCSETSDMAVVCDSDHAMVCSLAPPDQSAEFLDQQPLDERRTLAWVRSLGLNRHNFWYFMHPIRFHCGDMSDHWMEVEKDSEKLAKYLQQELDHPARMAFYRLLHGLYNFNGFGPRLARRKRLFNVLKNSVGLGWNTKRLD